ncbi:hypothetical protein [Chloroflexus islandicus]|nr:hypothetical protein [Chloroflexus islandicus]
MSIADGTMRDLMLRIVPSAIFAEMVSGQDGGAQRRALARRWSNQ